MLETLMQGNDWLTYIDQAEPNQKLGGIALAPDYLTDHESHELWEKTDRPLHFPTRFPPFESTADVSFPQLPDQKSTLARWLEENDVHTEFLDAGIGCCWYAQQGDEEPVCGETKEAAIEKLARQNGLEFSPLAS